MSEQPQTQPAKPEEGWSFLINYPKRWHYFRGGRSLCRRYMAFSLPHMEQGNDDSPDNCKACLTALKKEREKKAQ